MSSGHWSEFCFEQLGLRGHDRFVERWWNDVLFKYLEITESRPYHNITHIADLLALAQKHCGSISPSMGLAIYFHDVVYEPIVGMNEERSADIFREFASQAKELTKQAWCQEKGRIDDVFNWIIETKHHTTSTYVSPYDQEGFQLFLDFDMAILGSLPSRYEQYCQDVRREYAHIEDTQFRKGRSAFLQIVLSTPDELLYRTERMRELLLNQARTNIQREVERLAAGKL